MDEIRNEKMLVVEGNDDVSFFVKLLKELNILGVYVTALGSKNRFNDDLPELQKRPGFSKVTHLGIIRDKDVDNAFESVVNILKRKMGLTNIPTKNGSFASGRPGIGIFIMPGNTVVGTALEDLCLETVENHPAMQCVNDFASCISSLNDGPRNISKARVQAYLAAQPEIANSIGRGAEKNYWNFNSPVFNELKEFMANFK